MFKTAQTSSIQKLADQFRLDGEGYTRAVNYLERRGILTEKAAEAITRSWEGTRQFKEIVACIKWMGDEKAEKVLNHLGTWPLSQALANEHCTRWVAAVIHAGAAARTGEEFFSDVYKSLELEGRSCQVWFCEAFNWKPKKQETGQWGKLLKAYKSYADVLEWLDERKIFARDWMVEFHGRHAEIGNNPYLQDFNCFKAMRRMKLEKFGKVAGFLGKENFARAMMGNPMNTYLFLSMTNEEEKVRMGSRAEFIEDTQKWMARRLKPEFGRWFSKHFIESLEEERKFAEKANAEKEQEIIGKVSSESSVKKKFELIDEAIAQNPKSIALRLKKADVLTGRDDSAPPEAAKVEASKPVERKEVKAPQELVQEVRNIHERRKTGRQAQEKPGKEERKAPESRAQAIMPSEPEKAILQKIGGESSAERRLMLIDRELKEHPLYIFLRLRKADVLSELGDLPKAEVALNELLKIDGGFPPAVMRRGDIRRKLGRLDEALKDFASYTELKPEDGNGWLAMFELHRKMGRVQAAADALGKGVKATNDGKQREEMRKKIYSLPPGVRPRNGQAGAGLTFENINMGVGELQDKVSRDLLRIKLSHGLRMGDVSSEEIRNAIMRGSIRHGINGNYRVEHNGLEFDCVPQAVLENGEHKGVQLFAWKK